jgi:hypothetical protein
MVDKESDLERYRDERKQQGAKLRYDFKIAIIEWIGESRWKLLI